MIEIGMNQVRKNFGFKKVLDGISCDIMTNERVALVGRNGTGKSTVLKLIYGTESPDGGTISLRRGATVGMLEQIPKLRETGKTVREVLAEPFSEIFALERELRRMEREMAQPEADFDALLSNYSAAQEQYTAFGGYDTEERLSKITQGFSWLVC